MDKENDKEKDKIIAEEVGELPVNSRIYIDYEQNPPKISFGYPDTNTNQITHSSSTYLISIIISSAILLILVMFWNSYMHDTFFKDTYANDFTLKEVKSITYNFSNYSEIIVLYNWNNKDRTTLIQFRKEGFFWYYPTFSEMTNSRRDLLITVAPVLIVYAVFLILIILNAKWITLIFTKTKWGHKAFPEINKRLHGKGYSAEFFPQDVSILGYIKPVSPEPGSDYILGGDRWYVEIPMFKNMYMDYEASEEFSKYLTKISIVEHPFSRYVKKKGIPLTRIKKAKKKIKHSSELDIYYDKKTNIYLWKAIFEFKQKPTTGSLRLWFT